MAPRSKKASAPVEETPVEVEEIELPEEEAELDDVELDAEEVEEKPARKPRKAAAKKTPAKEKAPEVTFGSKELAEHVNAECGTSYDAYNLRILLRKLTKEGVLQRDETAARQRYSFTGPEDPQVVAIVEAVKSGAAEKAKTERLEELKEKRAAKKPAAKKTPARKAKAEPVVEEEDDFDIEDI